MQAVITADIVNSTHLKPKDFKRLIDDIKSQFEKPDQIEFYRGDSFQVLAEDGNKAFLKCLLCRFRAIALSGNERIDIRQSISLGKIKGKIDHLGSHLDDIFVSSGRTFDSLSESGRKLLITCGKADIDFTFDIIAQYTDSLLSQITAKQAAVLYLLLSGRNQSEAAKLLNKTAATINQHVKTSRLDEIQSMLKKYAHLTQLLENGK